MGQNIHLTNAAGRDGSVQLVGVIHESVGTLGLPGHTIEFRRYLAATEACRGDVLGKRLGEDYAQALIEGDPELNIEHVGRTIGETNAVYLTRSGETLHCPPRIVEVITNPDGTEKERRNPVDVAANIDDDHPVRWSGRKIPIAEAVRRFVFRRSLQITHVDGVTYDFLFAMAKDLEAEKAVMLVGAGVKGNEPLVFQANGRPCRGFLEGRINGENYQLLLHLSDMELKRPAAKKEA